MQVGESSHLFWTSQTRYVSVFVILASFATTTTMTDCIINMIWTCWSGKQVKGHGSLLVQNSWMSLKLPSSSYFKPEQLSKMTLLLCSMILAALFTSQEFGSDWSLTFFLCWRGLLFPGENLPSYIALQLTMAWAFSFSRCRKSLYQATTAWLLVTLDCTRQCDWSTCDKQWGEESATNQLWGCWR